MATLKDLLTDNEIKKCFISDSETNLTDYEIGVLSVKQLEFICFKILPIIFPDGIVTLKGSIISIGWDFLLKRAMISDIQVL